MCGSTGEADAVSRVGSRVPLACDGREQGRMAMRWMGKCARLAAVLGLAGLVATCRPLPASRLTVYNSNPYAVTVSGPGLSDASIGACGTAEWTWGTGWTPVSGTGPSIADAAEVTIKVSGAGELPSAYFVVVAGSRYTDYSAAPSPSLPGCTPAGAPAPSPSA